VDPVVAGSGAVAVVALLAIPSLMAWMGWKARGKAADEADLRYQAERRLDAATILSLRAEITALRRGQVDGSKAAQNQVDAAARLGSDIPDKLLWSPDPATAGGNPAASSSSTAGQA
jgi:hypothetical protein